MTWGRPALPAMDARDQSIFTPGQGVLLILFFKLCTVQHAVSVVKNRPANARDSSLIPGSGRSLEEEMATHCNILAWRIP